MTETQMQDALARAIALPTDLAIVPNVQVFIHESDLIRVTGKRKTFEYEVKISRGDFKRDLGKLRAYRFNDIAHGIGHYSQHAAMYAPNYFIYATSPGLITPAETPAYAGLIYVNEDGLSITTVRRAKRLHPEPIPNRRLDYLLRGQRIRYWRLRLNTPDAVES